MTTIDLPAFPTTQLYFESHITVEPVFDERLEELKEIVGRSGFRVADLLMKKRQKDSAERSQFDTFCTARSKDWLDIVTATTTTVFVLQAEGFDVWRYKIENTLLDERLKK